MKKLIITFFAVLATVVSLSAADATIRIKGSGIEKSESRRVDGFTEISVSSAIDLYVKQGRNFSVEVKADEKVIEYVETKLKGNRLVIRYEDGISFEGRNRIQTKVYVVLPELGGLYASAASDVYFQSNFRTDSLFMSGSSASDINLGEYEIKCSALKIELSSSSDFDGGVLRCSGKAKVSASSAADVDTYIKAETVSVEGSSASDITIVGVADYVRASASSGADIDLGELEGKEVRASASSGAGLTVNAIEKLDASASSGASVRYFGSPRDISRSQSSGGSVRAK